MGGGPASADVVRSSCILTFPEETLSEPVPVDAWYLHAVGLTFLRRLARDRVGDDMRIALVMQPVAGGDSDSCDDSDDEDSDSQKEQVMTSNSRSVDMAVHDANDDDDAEPEEKEAATRTDRRRRRRRQQQQLVAGVPAPKRYISVSSDAILRRALEETFEHPEKVLVLHVISLAKVTGAKSIHVRPEIHPNVSPEPVAPLGLVFPTLHVEGSVTRVPAATDSLLAMSSSYAMSKSVYVPPPHKSVDSAALAHSASFVEEREYTWRGSSSSSNSSSSSLSSQQQQQTPSAVTASEPPQKRAASSALPVATQVSDAHTNLSEIPVARVIGHAEPMAVSPSPSSASESDYVMLELQTGAGLGDPSGPSQTYFLASTWHVQAEEMSASMRLGSGVLATPAPGAVATTTTATAVVAAPWRWQQDDSEATRQQDDRAVPVAAVGLEDSFVVLERRAM